ncbi:MAG TPA: hypothetical protein VKN76_04445 [Kiloniellaceae bacterium]|nr:hypothetical protein [Kiloniellaceae bacterium]
MSQRSIERLDRILSTLAAGGAVAFFFSTVSYGWYQAFMVMAR